MTVKLCPCGRPSCPGYSSNWCCVQCRRFDGKQHTHWCDTRTKALTTPEPEPHYFQWGSRAAGGVDICVCGEPKGKCAQKVEIKYADGQSTQVIVPSKEQLDREWEETKDFLNKNLPGWNEIPDGF